MHSYKIKEGLIRLNTSGKPHEAIRKKRPSVHHEQPLASLHRNSKGTTGDQRWPGRSVPFFDYQVLGCCQGPSTRSKG